jgi:hypothetical protein
MKTKISSMQVSRQGQIRKLEQTRERRASANERTEPPEGARRSGAGAHAQQIKVRRKGQAQKTALDVCVLLPGTGKQDTISRAVTEDEKGGQVSISPPANHHFKILLSGIDTLYLAIYVDWKNSNFFDLLDRAKTVAKEYGCDCPLFTSTDQDISFMVCPNGSKGGYTWVAKGKEYSLKVTKALTAGTRPSVMVEIRSETLWRFSPSEACKRIVAFLEAQGARIINVKSSRLDLCMDLLLPEKLWTEKLLNTAVTRSTEKTLHIKRNTFTGFTLGVGDISARFYDKALEIEQKSKKFWFYDLWMITEVPVGFRLIRIEFQIRRTIIKNLGLDTLDDTFPALENIWAYCSQKWLTFRNFPHREHHRRPVSTWWQVVQNSFLGIEHPAPLIRAKAIAADQKRIAQQAYGFFTTLLALRLDNTPEHVTAPDLLDEFLNSTIFAGKDPRHMTDEVAKKVLKLYRGRDKQKAARQLRKEMGFPCNLPKEDEP